jgi:hypothetical protein
MNIDQVEHFADKYGFPILIVIWMFWRDWYFVKSLAIDMKLALNLLDKIANKTSHDN